MHEDITRKLNDVINSGSYLDIDSADPEEKELTCAVNKLLSQMREKAKLE